MHLTVTKNFKNVGTTYFPASWEPNLIYDFGHRHRAKDIRTP